MTELHIAVDGSERHNGRELDCRRVGQFSAIVTPRRLNVEAAAVARERKISTWDLLSRQQARKFSRPRQELMWRLRQAGFSFPQIAAAMNRTPDVIQHGVRAHAARCAEVAK